MPISLLPRSRPVTVNGSFYVSNGEQFNGAMTFSYRGYGCAFQSGNGSGSVFKVLVQTATIVGWSGSGLFTFSITPGSAVTGTFTIFATLCDAGSLGYMDVREYCKPGTAVTISMTVNGQTLTQSGVVPDFTFIRDADRFGGAFDDPGYDPSGVYTGWKSMKGGLHAEVTVGTYNLGFVATAEAYLKAAAVLNGAVDPGYDLTWPSTLHYDGDKSTFDSDGAQGCHIKMVTTSDPFRGLDGTVPRVIVQTYAPSGYSLSGHLFADSGDYPETVQVDIGVVGIDNILQSTPSPFVTHRHVNASPNFSDAFSASYFSTEMRLASGSLFAGTAFSCIGISPSVHVPGLLGLNNFQDVSVNGQRIRVRGPRFNAVHLQLDNEYNHDDCTTLTGPGYVWGSLVPFLVSNVGGTIHCDGVTSGGGVVSRSGSLSLRAYRFLRHRIRSIGAANQTIQVTVDETWGSQDTDRKPVIFSRQKTYHMKTGADGTFVLADIDLCSPDDYFEIAYDSITHSYIYTHIGLPGADDTDHFLKVDAGALWQFSGAYWGCGVITSITYDISASQVIEIDYIHQFRVADPLLSSYAKSGIYDQTGYGRTDDVDVAAYWMTPQINVDEKRSYEFNAGDETGNLTFSDLITDMNGVALYGRPIWAGWRATPFPTIDLDLSATRPGWWLGGGGVLLGFGATQHYQDIPMGSGLDVVAQVVDHAGYPICSGPLKFNPGVLWYPGAGDFLGQGAYGTSVPLTLSGDLRTRSEGICLNSDGSPNAGQAMECQGVDGRAAGTGSTNTQGGYRTASPWAKPYSHRTRPVGAGASQTVTRPMGCHLSRRASFRTVDSESNPWMFEAKKGIYYRTNIRVGDVHFWRSNYAVPDGWAVVDVKVTDTGHIHLASDPRIIQDHRGLLYLIWSYNGDSYVSRSDDGGASWSAPVVAIAGGLHPTIAYSEHNGAEIRAAFLGNPFGTGDLIRGQYRATGNAAYSALTTFKDSGGSALAVGNDTFHLAPLFEEPGRWALHCKIAADGFTSVWFSAHGPGFTFENKVAGITGGAHPTISGGKGGRILIAAVVAGTIKGKIRQSGDAAFGSVFTFVDETGSNLAVADDTFHLMPAREGPGRYVMHVLRTGETTTSDWWSGDGASWKRF